MDTNQRHDVFEVQFTWQTRKGYVVFGFVSGAFNSFESGSWSFGSGCFVGWDDACFYNPGSVFKPSQQNRFGLTVGDKIRMRVDCKNAVGRWWKESAPNQVVETSLPTKFGIAAGMQCIVGTVINYTEYRKIE